MKLVNLAPIPEVPKNVGKSWPLNKNYYEKVKQNAPELVKPPEYAKVNDAYDGKTNKTKKASQSKASMIASNNQGLQNNLANYTAKPDYLIDESVMFKTTTAMKTKNLKSSPMKMNAFTRGRGGDGGASLNPDSPARKVNYALGSNKGQLNLVL